MTFSISDIILGVRRCVIDFADVKQGENVFIITDTSIHPLIAQTFAAVCREAEAEPIILTIPSEIAESSEVGGDIPPHLVSAIKGADIIFSPTSYPLQHTPAIRPLVAHGHEDVFSHRKWVNLPPPHHISLSCDGATKVPGELIVKITKKTLEKMRKGKTFRMTTESGTDITTEQNLYKLGGSLFFPLPEGRFQVFPYGVVNPGGYIHKTGNGIMVLDAVDHFLGLLKDPVAYTIKDGYVVKIDGGFEAKWINSKIEKVGRDKAAGWWEFSIGMNPCIPIYKNDFEGLKAHWHAFAHRTAGAVHISIGIDPDFHLHGTILEPTITCVETGDTIIEKGYLKTLDDSQIKEELDKYGIVPSRW